jgi:hypothetical protein
MRAKKTHIVLFAVGLVTPSLGAGPVVRTNVARNGNPVERAMVVLQSFADKNCVKLFREKNPKPDTAAKLHACTSDLPAQFSDASGEADFLDLKPGWYAVHVLFLFEPQPSAYQTACRYGDVALMISSHRDTTGKYNAMAQREPFEIKSAEDVKQEFRFDQALGANGKCLTFP